MSANQELIIWWVCIGDLALLVMDRGYRIPPRPSIQVDLGYGFTISASELIHKYGLYDLDANAFTRPGLLYNANLIPGFEPPTLPLCDSNEPIHQLIANRYIGLLLPKAAETSLVVGGVGIVTDLALRPSIILKEMNHETD